MSVGDIDKAIYSRLIMLISAYLRLRPDDFLDASGRKNLSDGLLITIPLITLYVVIGKFVETRAIPVLQSLEGINGKSYPPQWMIISCTALPLILCLRIVSKKWVILPIVNLVFINAVFQSLVFASLTFFAQIPKAISVDVELMSSGQGSGTATFSLLCGGLERGALRVKNEADSIKSMLELISEIERRQFALDQVKSGQADRETLLHDLQVSLDQTELRMQQFDQKLKSEDEIDKSENEAVSISNKKYGKFIKFSNIILLCSSIFGLFMYVNVIKIAIFIKSNKISSYLFIFLSFLTSSFLIGIYLNEQMKSMAFPESRLLSYYYVDGRVSPKKMRIDLSEVRDVFDLHKNDLRLKYVHFSSSCPNLSNHGLW